MKSSEKKKLLSQPRKQGNSTQENFVSKLSFEKNQNTQNKSSQVSDNAEHNLQKGIF